MTATTPCTIKLLNKTYHLRCPAKEEHALTLAAEKLDTFMRKNKQKFPTLNEERLLLLSALEVSHTLIQKELDIKHSDTEQDMQTFIQSLEERLQTIALCGQELEPVSTEEP